MKTAGFIVAAKESKAATPSPSYSDEGSRESIQCGIEGVQAGDCDGMRVLAKCCFPACVDDFEISERTNLKTGKEYQASSKRAEYPFRFVQEVACFCICG